MKTIEEAAKDAYVKAGYNAYFDNGFKAGVAFYQQWINVEDELPTNNNNVLYRDSDGEEFLAFYTPELNEWTKFRPVGNPVKCDNIVEWRPIERK